jgi:ParB/RepB/Spo0J family partition protein
MKIVENNKVVGIDELSVNDYNPKKDISQTEEPGLKEQFERLKKSLQVGGQDQPILVRELEKGYEIVDGEHRYYAMKELGFEKVEIKNLGNITRQEAIARLLSHDLKFEIDPVMEAKLLKEWVEAGWDLTMLAYSEQDVLRKVEILNYSIEDAMGKLPVIELEEGAEDAKLEAEETFYVSCNKKNYDWLVKNFKGSRGKFALNGNKIVEILSGKREGKKT